MAYYLPEPSRVWSRVQSDCTFLNPGTEYNTESEIRAIALAQMLRKGNILQHKGNSAQLTKKEIYSRLAKGYGPSRTKGFATQSEKYSNPNTKGYLRVGAITIPFPNQIVGQPNNISGPYAYDVPNPDNCNTDGSLLDGGTLICGVQVNPCTNERVSQAGTLEPGQLICNLSTCSDVPGTPIALCWDPALESWFPKPRYVMNNSTDKWPDNYKGFVSAVKPEPPTISINGLVLSWTFTNNCEVPVSSFRIFQNGQFFTSVVYTITSYTFTELQANDSIYVTSVSRNIESAPSNIVVYL